MFEPIVHFLLDVRAVLVKLSPCPCLKVLDPLVLPVDLGGDALVQLSLPGESLLLLDLQGLLDLGRLLVQRVQDLTLLLHSSVPLSVDTRLDPSQVRPYRVQLVLQRLYPVLSLLLH